MSAPMGHMDPNNKNVYFPLRSGACLVKTRPAFSHDQKYLFVCSGSVIKVYSISSGECIHELCGHRDYVTGIAIHPKNKLQLVSCSLDKKIIVWDYTDGVLLREIYRNSMLHAVYTIEGDNRLFLLQQSQNKKVCDVICLSLSKKAKLGQDTRLLTNCSPDCRKTTVGPKGTYCAMVNSRELVVKNISADRTIKHRLEDGREFTCVIGHPSGQCVATGCQDGKIYLWYKYLQEKTVAVKSLLHWHSLPVRDLCYTREGSYLLSGGHECVLVKWHHESGYKDFMPRLGAPINHIVCSQDNILYAACFDDNVIQIVTSSFDIEKVYQGLTRGHHVNRMSDPFPAGLTYDPRSDALVLNGRPGHIQFYSVHEDKQLYNLDIVCQNYISPAIVEKPMFVTDVTKADFDSTGEWLATIEYWNDGVMTPEMRLKFWQYNKEKQSFVLNTTVEMPHDETVHTLAFRPVSSTSAPGMKHMLVTSSSDGKFKIWILVDDTDIYRSNEKWTCESVGFYRDLPASAAAFSEDGSLLAVVFGPCITLWNPENNLLKQTFENSMYQDRVRKVIFGNGGCSQYLVSTTDTTLTVWSLLSCTVMWSASTKIKCWTKDPRTDIIAAFTRNDLFVFRPSDPSPLFSHAGVSDSAVLNAAFVPHSKKSLYKNTTLAWQAQSELYFMNEQQELLAVSLERDTKSAKMKQDVVSFEQNLPQTALSQLMSQHSNKSTSRGSTDTVTKQPDGKFLRELFSSAAHVQPSMSVLCRPFIQSLMVPSHGARKSRSEDNSDEEEEVTSYLYQTVSHDSGLDSDMEVETSEAQSNVVINTSQSDSENKTKEPLIATICEKLDKVKVVEETVSADDLKKIFASDLSWYSATLKPCG